MKRPPAPAAPARPARKDPGRRGPLSRRAVLAGAAAAGGAAALGLAPAAAAKEPRAAGTGRYGFAPQEVAPGIWMIEGRREVFSAGNGGAMVNVAFIETAEGAVIVDTGSSALMGQEIRAFADGRLGGVAAVVNTHQHPDHWFGNGAFADRPILALGATAAACRANAQGYAESLYAILGGWMAGTDPLPPERLVAPGEIRIGGRPLRLMAFSGHTAADLALLDETSGVLIAGDLAFLDRAPSLPDADFAAWLAAIDEIARIEAAGLLPGHGPFRRSNEALVQTRAYLETVRDRLDQAAGLGLSPIEAMAAGPPPAFAALGANPEEYLRSVAIRWADHEIGALPLA